MRWLAGIVITVLLAGVFFYKLPIGKNESATDNSNRLSGQKIQIDPGKFISVKNTPELNPLPEGDFAVLFWFNMKGKLANGEKTYLAEKFDNNPDNKPGWAIRISNHKKIFRPEIYWKNASGNGRWYSFAEFPFKQDRWFGLLLSYKKGQYLGLKAYQLEKGKNTESINLGGYFLPGVFPTSSADLRVGSVGGQLFSGTIGKVYAGTGLLEKNWQELISDQCLKAKNQDPFCVVH